jgi:hypothetical protein
MATPVGSCRLLALRSDLLTLKPMDLVEIDPIQSLVMVPSRSPVKPHA